MNVSRVASAMVAFYQHHAIAPVHQQGDTTLQFAHRAALYRQLGIGPRAFRDARVLEIGPGVGVNARYVAAQSPAEYVLLEPNPTAADATRAMLKDARSLAEVIPCAIEDFASTDRFDVVLCEGVFGLSGVADPTQLLRLVADRVEPGGVLVITCIDPISDLSERLRLWLARQLVSSALPFETQVAQLVKLFRPHLATIDGMTRPHADWVADNLLNPASAGAYCAMPTAIDTLPDCEFLSSAPHFVTDWRWYKTLATETQYSARAIDAYWQYAHALIDHRDPPQPRAPEKNRQLMALADELSLTMWDETAREHLRSLAFLIANITPSFKASQALREFAGWCRSGIDASTIATAPYFSRWFGRGQQYVSFTRRTA